MQVHIEKWGNSLGVRIPNQIAEKLNLHHGSAVNFEVKNNQIIIQSPKYDLDTMLNCITTKNKHHQIMDAKKRGNEAW